jgi:hypothetical protein
MHHTPIVIYRERLLPGATIMFLGFGLFLMVGIAYSAAFGSMVGIVLALGISTVYFVFAITTAPQIRVEAHSDQLFLSAGRARINIAMISFAHQLTSTEQREVQLGTRNDTAFTMIKGKLPVVELGISDSSDPHRYWYVSSRSPEELIRAISTAQGPEIS